MAYFLAGPFTLAPEEPPIGTMAAWEEMCKVLEHSIFNNADWFLQGWRGGQSQWERVDRENVGGRWLIERLKVFNRHLYTNIWIFSEPTRASLEAALSTCLRRIYISSQQRYLVITTFLDHLAPVGRLSVVATECIGDRSLPEPRIPRSHDTKCITVSEKVSNNVGSFLVLLTLKEAHSTLMAILDRAEMDIEEQLKNQQEAKQEAARAEKERIDAEAKAENLRADIWRKYQSHGRTLLEKIFNYSASALEDGEKDYFWVSGDRGAHKCIMSFYEFGKLKRSLDIREMSERGFRISRTGLVAEMWRFGDEKQSFQTIVSGQVIERLQQAWTLAFRECPGKKTEF